MKKKVFIGIGALVVIFVLWYSAGALWHAFDQKWTKTWGGTMYIDLEKGKRIQNATWKEGDHLWMFIVPRAEGEAPGPPREFQEYSKYGVLEGKIIFREK